MLEISLCTYIEKFLWSRFKDIWYNVGVSKELKHQRLSPVVVAR